MTRWVAISDLHGNARALRAALALARREPFDRMVILGDLLTYGPDPAEVLDLVAAEVAAGASLLLGNHDELYLDLLDGRTAYYDGLGSWIRESVDWTLSRIDPAVLRGLPFVREQVEGELYLAHANPFGDWRYLNDPIDHREAGAALRARGLRVGLFGHTHRQRVVELPSERGMGDDDRSAARWAPADDADVLVLNAGSVGQPRNRAARATLLRLELDAAGARVRVEAVDHDVEGHKAALRALPLSEDARARLLRFHEPRG